MLFIVSFNGSFVWYMTQKRGTQNARDFAVFS